MHLCSVTVAPGCGWHVHVNSHALAMPLAMTYTSAKYFRCSACSRANGK